MSLVYDLDDMKNYIIFFIVYFLLQLNAYPFDTLTYDGDYGAIVGEEYWIFDDSKSGNPYSRGEVVWSYDGAPAVAQKCAELGHKQLKSWLENSDSIVSKYLKIIGESGGPTQFFLWTNDFQTNKATRKFEDEKIQKENGRKKRPLASVWNYLDGLLKYESSITPDGECHIPKESEVIESLDYLSNYFEDKRKSELNFIQRIFDGKRSRKFKSNISEVRESRALETGNGGAR